MPGTKNKILVLPVVDKHCTSGLVFNLRRIICEFTRRCAPQSECDIKVPREQTGSYVLRCRSRDMLYSIGFYHQKNYGLS